MAILHITTGPRERERESKCICRKGKSCADCFCNIYSNMADGVTSTFATFQQYKRSRSMGAKGRYECSFETCRDTLLTSWTELVLQKGRLTVTKPDVTAPGA